MSLISSVRASLREISCASVENSSDATLPAAYSVIQRSDIILLILSKPSLFSSLLSVILCASEEQHQLCDFLYAGDYTVPDEGDSSGLLADDYHIRVALLRYSYGGLVPHSVARRQVRPVG